MDLFLDHLEQYGSAEAMPEVSMPGHELGYVFSQGRSKLNCVVTCSSCLKILILGNLFLIITELGGRRHWELVASRDGVVESQAET